jgi:hypothetical protein
MAGGDGRVSRQRACTRCLARIFGRHHKLQRIEGHHVIEIIKPYVPEARINGDVLNRIIGKIIVLFPANKIRSRINNIMTMRMA